MKEKEILSVAEFLYGELQARCPVRFGSKKAGHSGTSPYPGNLKNNGIYYDKIGKDSISIVVGGVPAPYGVYTEKRSHKPNWQEQSHEAFLSMLKRKGGEIK